MGRSKSKRRLSKKRSFKGGADPSIKFLENASIDKQYFYLGHGLTFCDNDGSPIVKTMPTNTGLLTTTVCGSSVYHSPKYVQKNILSINQDIFRKILFKSEQQSLGSSLKQVKKYANPFAKKFFIPDTEKQLRTFSFRTTSQPYVDSQFSPVDPFRFAQDEETLKYVHAAGLQTVDTLWDRIEEEDQRMNDGLLTRQVTEFDSYFDVLQWIYKDALYPDEDRIFRALSKFNVTVVDSNEDLTSFFDQTMPQRWATRPTKDNLFWFKYLTGFLEEELLIKLSDLLDSYKGIHIWDVCRSFSNSCNPNSSINEQYL